MERMEIQNEHMDWESFGCDSKNHTGGTLRLHDGRLITVQQLNHVGALFRFYSRANDQRGHAISLDEIRAWKSIRLPIDGNPS